MKKLYKWRTHIPRYTYYLCIWQYVLIIVVYDLKDDHVCDFESWPCPLYQNNDTCLIKKLMSNSGASHIRYISLPINKNACGNNLPPTCPDIHQIRTVKAELIHTVIHDFSVWMRRDHYRDVIISAMASQTTSVSIVYSIVCWGVDQRKHQSSAPLAFVRGIHRWPVNSPVTGEFPAQRASDAENASI